MQGLIQQVQGWDAGYIQGLPGTSNLNDQEARAVHSQFLDFLSSKGENSFANPEEAWESFQNYRGTNKQA